MSRVKSRPGVDSKQKYNICLLNLVEMSQVSKKTYTGAVQTLGELTLVE